jgi:hypothetical protein
MGSFSVACSLSGLTLNQEPIVYIPLQKAKYHEPIESAIIVSNGIQSLDLYCPAQLPIFCEIGDYGDLVGIIDIDPMESLGVFIHRGVYNFAVKVVESRRSILTTDLLNALARSERLNMAEQLGEDIRIGYVKQTTILTVFNDVPNDLLQRLCAVGQEALSAANSVFDLWALAMMFSDQNRLMMPTICGCQWPMDQEQFNFVSMVHDILSDRINAEKEAEND